MQLTPVIVLHALLLPPKYLAPDCRGGTAPRQR
jgi:hypothetical protein